MRRPARQRLPRFGVRPHLPRVDVRSRWQLIAGHSLAVQLNALLMLFMAVLAVATAAIVFAGFLRTQSHATASSRGGLESEGRNRLMELATAQAFIGQLQMAAAADLGQEAARLMYQAPSIAAAPAWSASLLQRTPDGRWYDPRPDRVTDLLTFPAAALTPDVTRDLRDSAALDGLLPALFDRPSQLPEHTNFDAIAIYYVGPSGATRYYPPIGVADRTPPTTLAEIDALMAGVGPVEDPIHRTEWSGIYPDEFGRGDVITAYTPVYDGTTFRGVIGVDLSVAHLVQQIDQLNPSPTGFAFYVGRDGTIMRTSSADRVQAALDAPDNGAFQQTYRAMQTGAAGIERVSIDGRDVYVAHAPLGDIGGSLALVAPIDEITAAAADVTASINREGSRTLRVVLLSMAALFGIALSSAAWINRLVLLRPIAELLAGTRAVAAGDLSATIPVQSADELGTLAGSFNRMTAQLRETEGRYKNVFDSTRDGLVISRRDGQLVEANPAACAMHGYTREQFLALEPGGHIDPEFRVARREALEEVLAGRQYRLRSRDVRKDGSRFDVEAIGSGFVYGGEPHVLVVLRDITEQVRAEQLLEERVEERTHQLRTVLDVSREVTSTLDLHALAERTLDALRELVPYTGAGILLFEPGDREATILASRGPAGADDDLAGRRIGEVHADFVQRALVERRPTFVDDTAADPARAAWQRAETVGSAATLARSWLAVPLVAPDREIGLLPVWSDQPNAYGEREAELAMAIASQTAIAIENARLYQRASDLAAIEERQRLARELHDSVSQALYGIALGAHTARALLDTDPQRAIEPVEYVVSLAEAGLTEMRALIFELRPESLEAEGLVAALEKQVAAIRARYAVATEADLCAEPGAAPAVKEALYRIAQEALHNTIKHARASHIDVRLAQQDGTLELTVRDDGRGFDAAGDFPGHLGLRSMRERAAAAGGTVTIESSPGAGAAVTARFPVPPAPAAP